MLIKVFPQSSLEHHDICQRRDKDCPLGPTTHPLFNNLKRCKEWASWGEGGSERGGGGVRMILPSRGVWVDPVWILGQYRCINRSKSPGTSHPDHQGLSRAIKCCYQAVETLINTKVAASLQHRYPCVARSDPAQALLSRSSSTPPLSLPPRGWALSL